MYSNYFKTGFRNLNRNRGYSFINIGGLALGMAVAMMIGLWIYDELSYDRYHSNYSDIAQVLQQQTFGGVRETSTAVPRPLENAFRTEYANDLKYVSMATWTGDHILSTDDRVIGKTGNYFQEDFPEMLTLKMVSGVRTGLRDPSSILLSQSTAKALFGKSDCVNEALRIDNKYDVRVIGVYEDLPYNTTFHNLDFIASWELYVASDSWVQAAIDQWGNNSFQLFVQLPPGTDDNAITQKIEKVKFNAFKDDQVFDPAIILLPMGDWYLRSEFKDGQQMGGRIQMVRLFGFIGAFVLLLACINFTNLSTARSEKRAKEVGIRMTMGSARSQLINQFLSESFLVVILSFGVSLGLVSVSMSWFNEIANKQIVVPWSNWLFWLGTLAFIAITTIVAGSYPALYMSSFLPVKVLKGLFKAGRFSSLPRKVLVVVQFSVSVTLIIGTMVVYRQILFTKDRPIGYDRQGLVMIPMKSDDYRGKFDVLRNELKNNGAITELSESSSPLTNFSSHSGGFDWNGKDPALREDFATVWTTHEYGETVKWTITEGRDFSRDFATDSSAIILNEAAVKFLGVKDPVGMEIRWGTYPLHVIGVVKDMVTQSPYSPVKETMYLMSYREVSWINIRLNPEKSVSESMALVESTFTKVIPNVPFDYQFVDADFARKFSSEERVGKLAAIFAGLAILISCLGLFGLASFVAEQRTREIGIRKIHGASVVSLCRMLTKDFVLLVMISCMIAIPVAWYSLEKWLENYDYRTNISWWIFAIAVGAALLITLSTVGYQAFRAAVAKPVMSLKSE